MRTNKTQSILATIRNVMLEHTDATRAMTMDGILELFRLRWLTKQQDDTPPPMKSAQAQISHMRALGYIGRVSVKCLQCGFTHQEYFGTDKLTSDRWESFSTGIRKGVSNGESNYHV